MAFSSRQKLLRVVVSLALFYGTLTFVLPRSGDSSQVVHASCAPIRACDEAVGAAKPLFNPHAPHVEFAHHKLIQSYRVPKLELEPEYITEFTGLKVKFEWDCTPGKDSEGFSYFAVVPSRRFKCQEHTKAVLEGVKSYVPDLPIADDEYSQWVSIMESFSEAPLGSTYVYVELGARWGTWVARAATVIRELRPDLNFRGWAVEASDVYVSNMMHTLSKNDLVNSVKVEHSMATPALLTKFLTQVEYVDILDSDIQGAEFDLFADEVVFNLLKTKVRRLQIGTHDNSKHANLRARLENHGWMCVEDDVGRTTDACDSLISEDKYEEAVHVNCTVNSGIGPLYIRDGALSMMNTHLERVLKSQRRDASLVARTPDLRRLPPVASQTTNLITNALPPASIIMGKSIEPNSESSEERWKIMHVYVGKTSSVASKNLWQSFSQSKQDSIVKAMVPRSGYFIDLAANDWQKDSNTYSLETFENWNGLCIEPNEVYWSGLLRRKCVLVSAVISGKADELVQFASTKGGLGGIVATNMDNAHETSNLKEFSTTTIDAIFTKYHVPKIIDYMSLDIEGAESVVFPLLPFETYKIYIFTIERPKDDVRSVLRAQNYVEVGVLGDYGDTMFLHTDTPNFKEVLRIGQLEVTMQQRQINRDTTEKDSSDADLRPIRVNNIAMGVRCPYTLLDKCGRALPAWDTPYQEIISMSKNQ